MSTLTIYATGTLTFTNASANLVGAGTTLIGLQQGDPVLGPDGEWYELAASPSDNLAAVLDRPYAGTTATNSPGGTGWVIFRSSLSRDSVRTATKQLTDISSLWRTLMNVTQSDQVVKPSKATTGDRAGLVLAKALVEMFQVGMFQDDDFSVRYLLASTWTKALSVNAATGATTIFAQLLLGNAITPALITDDVNDYAPANLDQANLLRISTSATKNITGLTGGSPGRVLALINCGAHDVVLKKESGASVAANRFGAGIDVYIPAGNSCILIYDGTSNRWRPMGGGGGGAITIGTVTTGAAGSSASVTNSGSALAPVLDFVIPTGAQGPQGSQGSQGPVGPTATSPPVTWATGQNYVVGPPATVVQHGTTKNLYQCLVPHTSTTFPADLAAGKWQLISQSSAEGSSVSSLAIGLGTKVFATQVGLSYQNGVRLRASSAANSSNWMEGICTYDSAAQSLTMTVDKIGGSGTAADWLFNHTGQPGAGDLSSVNNLSELTATAATARANLGINQAVALAGGTNFNTLTTPGTYFTSTNTCTNTPVASQWYTLEVIFFGATYTHQRAVDANSGQTYTRNNLAGSWTAWHQALFSDNNLSELVNKATSRNNLGAVGVVKKQVFTSSGTYTPSANLLYAIIECVGGGAGGGGATVAAATIGQYGGGGGTSGGYSKTYASAAAIGASQTVTIGAAGSGGSAGANNGTDGGSTSVGTLCVANGGKSGKFGSVGQFGVAGAVAAAGTGDIAASGGGGGCGPYATTSPATNSFMQSGFGGSSPFGGGGAAVLNGSGGGGASNGNAGGGYGAGGSGGIVQSQNTSQALQNAAGGNGTAGITVITEFCSS